VRYEGLIDTRLGEYRYPCGGLPSGALPMIVDILWVDVRWYVTPSFVIRLPGMKHIPVMVGAAVRRERVEGTD